MLRILKAENIKPRFTNPGIIDRWTERLRAAEARWIGQTRFKAALILGFLFLAIRGMLVAITIVIIMVEVVAPADWQQIITTPWADGNPIGAPRLILFTVVLFSEAVIGILLLTVTGLILARQMRRGMMLGYWVLLFSLTALHLPVFYFEQFEGITGTLLQFGLLLGIMRYRAHDPDKSSGASD